MSTTAKNVSQESARPGSRLTLRLVSLILVVIGLGITGYLSYSHLTDTTTVCVESGAFNCDMVQHSIYSKLAGIPVAYLGFGAYVALIVLLVLENRVSFLADFGVPLVFGITLLGFLFSVWLTYIEFFRLQALCPWCLGSAAVMTVLFIVSVIRLRQSMAE
jgi:uncharacterized membrane protein